MVKGLKETDREKLYRDLDAIWFKLLEVADPLDKICADLRQRDKLPSMALNALGGILTVLQSYSHDIVSIRESYGQNCEYILPEGDETGCAEVRDKWVLR